MKKPKSTKDALVIRTDLSQPKRLILDYPDRPKPPESLTPEEQTHVDDFFAWMDRQESGPMREDGEPLTGIEAIDYPPGEAHPGNARQDRSHDEAMAELFRADPAYAAELLAEVRRDGDPAELRVLLRQLAAAFGPEWPGFSEDDRNTFSSV